MVRYSKPTRPAFGLEPRPVAPSSRISPPEQSMRQRMVQLPLGGYAFQPSSRFQCSLDCSCTHLLY